MEPWKIKFRKTKSILLHLFLILPLVGGICCKQQRAYRDDSIVYKKDTFGSFPEITPDSDYVIDFNLRGIFYDEDEFYMVRYKFNEVCKYWYRHYKYSSMTELRYHSYLDGSHYILGFSGGLRFYIKWDQDIKSYSTEYMIDSDINGYTRYLETNLSEKTIRKYFPEVRCPIVVKRPKEICVDIKNFQHQVRAISMFTKIIY